MHVSDLMGPLDTKFINPRDITSNHMQMNQHVLAASRK